MNVVVPPDIIDADGSGGDESVTNEGGQIQLVCVATGVPQPTVCTRCFLYLIVVVVYVLCAQTTNLLKLRECKLFQ